MCACVRVSFSSPHLPTNTRYSVWSSNESEHCATEEHFLPLWRPLLLQCLPKSNPFHFVCPLLTLSISLQGSWRSPIVPLFLPANPFPPHPRLSHHPPCPALNSPVCSPFCSPLHSVFRPGPPTLPLVAIAVHVQRVDVRHLHDVNAAAR